MGTLCGARELYRVMPAFRKTERGNVEGHCEVRILGNTLSVKETLGHWPSWSEQIAAVGPEGMAVGKFKQAVSQRVTPWVLPAQTQPGVSGTSSTFIHRQEAETSRVATFAVTEAFLFTRKVNFSPNKPRKAARGRLLCLRRGLQKHSGSFLLIS